MHIFHLCTAAGISLHPTSDDLDERLAAAAETDVPHATALIVVLHKEVGAKSGQRPLFSRVTKRLRPLCAAVTTPCCEGRSRSS